MRNRQVVNFLIYPKYFLSLAIPYKGYYFIRIKVYQKKILNSKITYAYPTLKICQGKHMFIHPEKANINISISNTYYQTQVFSLFYSDQKICLNTYCIFKLQYDKSRNYQTYFQFQLIRKKQNQYSAYNQACIPQKKQPKLDQLICKQVYMVTDYSQINLFQRVYFQDHQFFCALDMFIYCMNQGIIHRKYKYQIVQFKCNQKLQKKSLMNENKQFPCLSQLIDIINNQLKTYNQIRQLKLKSLLFINQGQIKKLKQICKKLQNFDDLSHLKYSLKDYEDQNIYQTLIQLNQDKKLINNNIWKIFLKLPQLIKDCSLSIFKAFIKESLKKKVLIKKKYLLKKVINNQILINQSFIQNNLNNNNNNNSNINTQRKSFQILPNKSQIERNSTFKQKRKLQKKQFIHIRRQQFIKSLPVINIKDCNFPMMLIQNFSNNNNIQTLKNYQINNHNIKNQNKKKQNDQICLIILIHGYQGSHYDLKKIKNCLEHINEKFKVLAINSIEKDIDENIKYLGKKIASEIIFYIQNFSENIKTISFIGFSLGGVLARASLEHLSKYKIKMKLLITLASPHLGISQSDNTLVNFGIWYLSKIDKAKNIKQLNFQSVTEKDSYLMKLSQQDQISWFQKVIIISCSQDEFVPHYSARITSQQIKNQQISLMSQNIMKRIKNCDKIQVWFDFQMSSTFDKMVGRKSHIQFIENYSFLETLCQLYEEEF